MIAGGGSREDVQRVGGWASDCDPIYEVPYPYGQWYIRRDRRMHSRGLLLRRFYLKMMLTGY